jgi:hypothetical protein
MDEEVCLLPAGKAYRLRDVNAGRAQRRGPYLQPDPLSEKMTVPGYSLRDDLRRPRLSMAV